MLAFSQALLLVAVSAPALALAQDVPAPRVSFGYVQTSGARLGVYLEQGCEIESNARGDCEESPRVRGVVDGSPADIAGIQAGDTLLALDGVALRSEPGRRALSRLRAGIPVEIEIGRESGRSTLRAIPSPRESSVRVRTRSGDVETLGEAPRADFNVFRFRDDSGEIAEFQFGPESDGPPSPDGFVVFSPDASGSLQVRVGEDGIAAMTVEGESITLTELEGHLVRLSESLHEGALELEVDVALDEVQEAVRHHLILANPQLARRLENVRIEALEGARVQLESLVARRSELESRGEIPPDNAYAVHVVPPDAPMIERVRSGGLVAGVPSIDHRLGGAEFRVLTPELAEYFDTESGLLVMRVISGTPFATLGLRGGDVVIEVEGHEYPDMPTFRHLTSRAGHNGVEVKWIRKGTVHVGQLEGN